MGSWLEISNDIKGSGIRTSSYTEVDEKSARIDHVDQRPAKLESKKSATNKNKQGRKASHPLRGSPQRMATPKFKNYRKSNTFVTGVPHPHHSHAVVAPQ